MSSYAILQFGDPNQWAIVSTATGETDTVVNVEVLQFDDGAFEPMPLV